ncbi:MAG: MBL fold metallo-hydrolase [Rhodospirillales bacterium]|nr:MBL fold metallo-hydrolase [Rhodospirillales bacterium]
MTPGPRPKNGRRARPGAVASAAGGVVALAFVIAATACSAPGHKPSSPYHHTTAGFRNPEGSPERQWSWRRLPWILGRLVASSLDIEPPPNHVVPASEALAALYAMKDRDTLTWIGHNTVLLRIGGTTVLTDPWFTDYASPIRPIGPRRYVPPGIAIEALPPIDVVVISHGHYDHLDLPTIASLPGRERTTAVVPLGLGRYFAERGYARVVELDWFEDTMAAGLKITALPVVHWSKRSVFKTNDTLWAGFAIERAGGLRIYFGGDAEYGPIYGEITDQYGGFDVGLLSIGAFLPRFVMNGAHCVPRACIGIATDLDVHTLVGIHWGTVPLGSDGPLEAATRFREGARGARIADDRVWLLKIGETRELRKRPKHAEGRQTGG